MSANPAIDRGVRVVALDAGGNEAGIVGVARPRLRWRLEAGRNGVRQRAYQVQVARDPGFAEIVATSEEQVSALPLASDWPAAPLESRETCWARIRVRTDAGVSEWSAPLRIEAALLSSGDWSARPVSPLGNVDRVDPAPVPLLRFAFELEQPVASARLYVTALGVHESYVNGQPVGDALLEPGWTAYRERLLYAAHDVTALLRQGENVLAAAVGDGWWRGWLTWMERRALYGATTAYLAQLELTLADGSTRTIGTDERWRGGTGGLLMADLYDGCTRDLRREPAGWQAPGFDATGWEEVRGLPLPTGLELRPMPPVRAIERWMVAVTPAASGRWQVDTGQNLAGVLRLTVSGPAGAAVTVRHAEVLDDDGTLYTAPLRNARAADAYVLAGSATTVLEPSFTFHGFRYAEIVADAGVTIDTVEVVALASDLPRIGRFACSDPLVNRLYENVRWSQAANFLALPTDCPQRDERLGWTGDIQVFADTACTNTAAGDFLASWLVDLAIEQRDDGNVPSTVPNVIDGHEFEYGGVGWGDAATLVPWSIYQAFGDPAVLARQFDSMRRWVDWGLSRRDADGTWRGDDFHLGDWLDPGAPSDEPQKATTDSHFIATAYLARSAAVLADAAAVLDRPDAVAQYRAMADEVAGAAWARWRDHAVTTQAGCAIAIEFAIAPAAERAAVGRALAALVERGGGRIATGFLGTPLVLPALTATGQIDAAYRLLLNQACPGWLYQVQRGATTMWERWDAVHEDGTLHAGEMSAGGGSSMISFNHYAYGAVAAWLYRTVAGIATEAPGYERIVFAPRPGGGLTSASASIDTPFGRSGIAWRIGASELVIELEIAAGATARLDPPPGWESGVALPLELRSGRHRFAFRSADETRR